MTKAVRRTLGAIMVASPFIAVLWGLALLGYDVTTAIAITAALMVVAACGFYLGTEL